MSGEVKRLEQAEARAQKAESDYEMVRISPRVYSGFYAELAISGAEEYEQMGENVRTFERIGFGNLATSPTIPIGKSSKCSRSLPISTDLRPLRFAVFFSFSRCPKPEYYSCSNFPEINAYKRVAGEAIFEIGRRLKHVKENDLAHGQYIEWLRTIEMTPRHAQQFVQLADEFEGNAKSVAHLGFAKLLQIAQLPSDIDRADFVSKPHTIPSTGATKTVDEMTVRELREVKAALKEERERCERERQAREKAEARAHLPRVFRGFYAELAAFTCAECYRRGNGIRAVI